MKIETKVATVVSNATFDRSEKMTIDEASIAHIFRVLTDIYSDPAASIVREYSANGLDSHVLAGQTKPVEVTFPTYLNPSFIVKDFGVGMSRDDLVNVYRKYGASTKRDSNDQIGAFGLGAKSALALVPQFTVNSVQNGKRNVVIISKNEEGSSDVNFLAETDTDEPNGVTVTIPVPNANEFERVRLSPIYLGWKPGSVLVNGETPASIHDENTFTRMGEYGWFEPKAAATAYYGLQNMRALVGPVTYTIPADKLSGIFAKHNLTTDSSFARTLSARAVLNLPNGSVHMTPSREDLIFNKPTLESIQSAFDGILDGIRKWAKDRMKNATTHAEAIEAAAELTANHLLPTNEPVVWKGEKFAKVDRLGNLIFTFLDDEEDLEKPERIASHKIAERWIKHKGSRVSVRDGFTAHFIDAPAKVSRDQAFILITEAERDVKGSFTTNSSLSRWWVGATQADDTLPNEIRILTTDKKASDLSPFLISMAHSIVLAEDVKRIARENRKAVANRTKRERTTIPVSVKADLRSSGKVGVDNVDSTTLDASTTYIIVQAATPGTRTFEGEFYAYFRRANSESLHRNLAEKVIRSLSAQGYRFVVLPVSADRKKIEALLPVSADLGETLAAQFNPTLNSIEREYVVSNAARQQNYSRSMDTAHLLRKKSDGTTYLDEIVNDDTREFLSLCALSGNGSNYPAVQRGAFIRETLTFRRNLNGWGGFSHFLALDSRVKDAYDAFDAANKGVTVSHRYPLIDGGVPRDSEQDAVDYINMVDARQS